MTDTPESLEPAASGPARKNEKAEPMMPTRPTNAEVRDREYLTPDEVEALIDAAKRTGRHGHRDSTLILFAYTHGLRNLEICRFKRSQLELDNSRVHIKRVKNGKNTVHPLRGREIRALRRLLRLYPDSDYVFSSERGTPLDTSGVRKLVARAGREAGFDWPVHPHQLRHGCGYKLANDGHDTRMIQEYLGHKDIGHTVQYTELAADRFAGLWDD